MERLLRLALPAGGAALVISLLVGILAGVSLGAALVRALISGVVFAALAAVVSMVSTRLLPGIASGPAASAGDGDMGFDDDEAGSDLDEPVAATPGADEGEQASPAPRSGSRLNIVVDDSVDADDVNQAEDTGDDDDPATADLVEEVEESAADDEAEVMSAAISEQQDGSSVEIDDTMLDEMPDIGSFAGSFVSGEASDDEDGSGSDGFDPGPSGGASGGASSGGRGIRVGDKNEAPEQIAKALQTMLKRDSDG